MRFLASILLCLWMTLLLGCQKPSVDFSTIYLGGDHANLVKESYSLVTFELDWEASFPFDLARSYLQKKQLLILHWYPWVWEDPSTIVPEDILNGDWDDVIDSFAKQAKQFGYPIFLSPHPFANFSKHPLSIDLWCQGDFEEWIGVQTYIFNKFKEHGAENVLFMWAFDFSSFNISALEDIRFLLKRLPFADWIGLRGADLASLNNRDLTIEQPLMLYVSSTYLSDYTVRSFLDTIRKTEFFMRGLLFLDELDEDQNRSLKNWSIHPRFRADISCIHLVPSKNLLEVGQGEF